MSNPGNEPGPDLIELVQQLGQPQVLVVGDLMLDRYVWGNAARISQEAPVILLHADRREEKLGGASSVATMLRALGARVALAGVVGDDADGRRAESGCYLDDPHDPRQLGFDVRGVEVVGHEKRADAYSGLLGLFSQRLDICVGVQE